MTRASPEGAAVPRPEGAAPILVVDDEQPTRESLGALLESLGHGVVLAQDGLQALDRLRTAAAPPSLILLDMMMPVMSGWRFLEARAQDPGLAGIPVVVISAALDASARLPGVAGYLRKPIGLDDLEEALRRVLERHDRTDGESALPAAAGAGAPGNSPRGAVRVLLVQTDDRAATRTRELLERDRKLSFEVDRCEDLEAGLRREAVKRADLLLLDLSSAGVGPDEALVQAARRAPGLPVVALDGPGEDERRERLFRLGAHDVLDLDSAPGLLAPTLHHVVERNRLRLELERAQEVAAFERERQGLLRWSRPRLGVATEILGQSALKQSSPERFDGYVLEFIALCEQAVAEKGYGEDPAGQRARLLHLAESLAGMRVGPADLVDIYQTALERAWSGGPTELEAARREEARLMLIGLLGFVLAAYRMFVS